MKVLLFVLVVCVCIAPFLVASQRVELTRRTHLREHIRQVASKYLNWPEDAKLPIRYQRNEVGLATATVPLLGNSLKLGEVYMDLPIGTPAYNYTAQVDTGSSDLGLPDNQCTTCGKVANIYNPSQSSTAKVVACSGSSFTCPNCSAAQCAYSISYGDGSGYDARLYTDQLAIPGFKAVSQGLGGIFKEIPSGPGEPFEPFPVDGIVGIAYQALSETNAPTIVDSLYKSGQIANQFSLCLTDDGGTFEFGGVLPYYSGSFQFTPITRQLFYQVNIADMLVNGVSLGVSSSIYNIGGAIFDSGTTEFLMPAAAFNSFKTIVTNNCTKNPLVGACNVGSTTIFDGRCFQMTAAQIAAYPTITIKFSNGATLAVPPSYYILDGGCTRAGYYTMWVAALGPLEGTILGDVVHRPYTVLYDRTNSRIGWAPVNNCPDGNA